MERRVSPVAIYVVIACMAALLNIGAQMASVAVYKGRFYVELSMIVGLATVLPVKYLLEKLFVFSFASRGLFHDARLFTLYTVLGGITTLVFVAVEYLFHLLFAGEAMRYVGAALGLALGHLLKYQLDRRFVFASR